LGTLAFRLGESRTRLAELAQLAQLGQWWLGERRLGKWGLAQLLA
jgi:hypothetical protein